MIQSQPQQWGIYQTWLLSAERQGRASGRRCEDAGPTVSAEGRRQTSAAKVTPLQSAEGGHRFMAPELRKHQDPLGGF